eukprot:11520035-Alexandrium_andersonii.AAC.1
MAGVRCASSSWAQAAHRLGHALSLMRELVSSRKEYREAVFLADEGLRWSAADPMPTQPPGLT